jgi:hypothetical protein
MDYVRRMIDASDRIWRELQMTGGEVTQGAAVFAGLVARTNAVSGCEEIVGMVSAEIVMRLASGGAKTIN